jgi:hypothetical protein
MNQSPLPRHISLGALFSRRLLTHNLRRKYDKVSCCSVIASDSFAAIGFDLSRRGDSVLARQRVIGSTVAERVSDCKDAPSRLRWGISFYAKNDATIGGEITPEG